jgi:hypothetical protein
VSQYADQPAGTEPYAGRPPAPRQGFGAVAAALAVVAAVLGVLAFTALNWFNGDNSTFGDIKTVVTSEQAKAVVNEFAKLYFSWLGWVLLAAAVVAALLAAMPGIGSAFRVVGLILAIAGIVATFIALKFYNAKAGSLSKDFDGYSTYLKHARLGFYFAVAAFVVAGIASLAGPRRARV